MHAQKRSDQNKEVEVLRIILVRHGQTKWNAGSAGGEFFRGRIDVPLNALGEAQAQAVAERLAVVEVSAVYASPLQRAVCTAQPIARAHGLAVTPLEGLLDIDYGEWGGLAHTQVAAEWPALYARWRSAPHEVQVPGGESLAVVRRRTLAGLDEIFASHQDEIVVMVGHQVVNKVFLCAALGLGNDAFWRIRQDTCCINRLDHDGETFTLLTLNELGHLPAYPEELDRLPS
jgi:broad specificity phosphatase PhoE